MAALGCVWPRNDTRRLGEDGHDVMAKRTLKDEPTISKKEALLFFNVGKVAFAERWESALQFKIRHIDTDRGRRLALIDVLKVAFPGASENTLHRLALEYLIYARDRRIEKRYKAEIKDDGEVA